jgi:hypothetical protein
MMDPAMQQAMAGMAGDPTQGGGGPSDQELLMLILQLIASGELSGPGVDQIAQMVGAPMGAPGGDPMAGAAAPGGAPGGAAMGGGMPPMIWMLATTQESGFWIMAKSGKWDKPVLTEGQKAVEYRKRTTSARPTADQKSARLESDRRVMSRKRNPEVSSDDADRLRAARRNNAAAQPSAVRKETNRAAASSGGRAKSGPKAPANWKRPAAGNRGSDSSDATESAQGINRNRLRAQESRVAARKKKGVVASPSKVRAAIKKKK